MITIRTFVLTLAVLSSIPHLAQATTPYVDTCGVISLNNIPVAGAKVEAVRCSDDVVLVSQTTFPGLLFNYHLRYDEPDDGQPGGQFQGFLTPIRIYLRVTYPGCEPLVIDCDEIADGYDQTIEGKLTLFLNLPCATPLQTIGDYVFCDVNNNGFQEDNEPGVPGVRVNLSYPAAGGGTTLLSTNTDAAGRYAFTGIPDQTQVTLTFDDTTLPPDKAPGKCERTFTTLISGGTPYRLANFCVVRVPELDTDGDEMSDAWETQFGLKPLDETDAELDPDQDGYTNLQEFLAQTNPTDSASRLTITSVDIVGDDVRIRFQGKRWKVYTISRLTALGSPNANWIQVDVPVTPSEGDAELEIIDYLGANRPTRFYRLDLLP